MRAPDQYTHDVDADYPRGKFLNETSLGAGDGTNTEANLFIDVYYAMINVILASGITWTGEDLETQGGTTDLLNAITAYARTAAGNPFINRALFQEVQPSGTNAVGGTAGAFSKRPIEEKENEITGCSVTDGVVTLPAGTYGVRGSGIAHYSGDANHTNITGVFEGDANDTPLVTGLSQIMRTDSRLAITNSTFTGTFTLAEESTVTLRTYSNVTGRGLAVSAGVEEKYAELEIFKLD